MTLQSQIKLLLAFPDSFIAWLKTQPADKRDEPRSHCDCWLSRFLQALTGNDRVNVTSDEVEVLVDNQRPYANDLLIPRPAWTEQYIKQAAKRKKGLTPVQAVVIAERLK